MRELGEAVIIFVEAVRVLIKDARGRGSLKGPKHDQIECGFFYINQTSMGR